MEIVARVTQSVQRVFLTLVHRVGEECELIKRKRVFDAASLAQTVMFGFLQNPLASWEELAQVAALCGAAVSPQAVRQRFNATLVKFLQQLCEAMCVELVTTPPSLIPLLQRFTGVFLDDSSWLALPPEYARAWPGSGGSAGAAAVKLQTRLDLSSGRLAVRLEAGRHPDQKACLQREPLPPGSLRIADLGYFCLRTLSHWNAQQVYFLSRMQSGTAVFLTSSRRLDVLAWAKANWSGKPLELSVLLGSEAQLPVRLIALRVPQEMAAKRRQRLLEDNRRKGRTPTAHSLEWCDWTIYVTNVEPERLSWKEAVVLYRARWQIELLFKLWKSHGCLAQPGGKTPHERVAILLGRLLAVLVQHWLLLASVWQIPQRSLTKAARAIRGFAASLVICLPNAEHLERLLHVIGTAVSRSTHVNKRKHKPSHYQLLQDPELLRYSLS